MANHKSALKRIKQTKVRTQRNRFYKTRIKNITKSVVEAIESGNKEEAQKSFVVLNKNFHKFVSKGILKKNTAARKVSRLNKRVNAL